MINKDEEEAEEEEETKNNFQIFSFFFHKIKLFYWSSTI